MSLEPRATSQGGLSGALANSTLIGGIAGIAYVVLFIAGILIQGDAPMLDDDAGAIREFFANSDDANMYLIGDWLTGVAFITFFLPFLSALRTFLAPSDPSGGTWVRAMFAGGLLILATGAAASIAYGALATGGVEELDDSTLVFASQAAAYGFGSAVGLSIAAFLLLGSLVILAGGALWRWLGAAGILLGLCNLVGALWVVEGDQEGVFGVIGIIGFIGFGLWNLAASIGLIMKGRRSAAI